MAGFQSSNYVAHYKRKHPNIAYNKELEKNKQLKQNIPSTTTTDFFRKRLQANTIVKFNEDEAYHKILNFIIENNLSFNILNSESFKDLLSYYNKSTPTINRWKIKQILNNTFKTALNSFTYKLKEHLNNNGSLSATLDI